MVCINLNQTEYIAYLECPLKFYLMKTIQKDNHFATGELHTHKDNLERLQDGMLWHQWFSTFHSIYHNCIIIDDRPLEGTEASPIAHLFYEFELKRYRENPEYWVPIAQNVEIKNDYYCGLIDRVDQINDLGHCRIIEIKASRKQYTQEELFFYAVLLSHEKERLDWFPKNGQITELATYYYTSGEFSIQKISEGEIIVFEAQLYNTMKEMLRPNMKKKKGCNCVSTQCQFKEICKRMPL